MKNKGSTLLKLIIGILVSVLLLYLAFNKIKFDQMKDAFQTANYWWLVPAVVVQLISHWVRSIRWTYLLARVKQVPTWTLFYATMIGYFGNTVLPAHLGEFFRGNVVGKKEGIPTSSVLATIIIERIIDMFSVLLIMVGVLLVYPFPDMVKTGGYVMLTGTVGLALFLVLLKVQNERTMGFVNFFLRLLPQGLSQRIEGLIEAFVDGINGLSRKRDYIYILVHSILIWALYWLALYLTMEAFNLSEIYKLNAISSAVVLVVTAISVVIPSSPGYVGAYHYACQLALAWFGVPRAVGLSFAFVAHGISVVPTALIGFVFAWQEGLKRLNVEAD